MSEHRKLPLFPLETVLFPGMLLPLHIFELRYRMMIERCIEQSQPFGVVLIKEGMSVGGRATPYDVGTVAYITNAEKEPDGRLNIETVGYKRFRIQEIQQTSPYMVGLVSDFPVEGIERPEIKPLVAELRPALRLYLDKITKAADITLSLNELPDDGMALAYFVAIMMPIPMSDKQTILQEATLADILVTELRLIRRELALLRYMTQNPKNDGSSPEMPFSSN